MSQTITRNQNAYRLLAALQLPVNAVKAVSTITRSGTTATITSTSHGLVVGDSFIVYGADKPPYNGLMKVVTQPDANTVTCTIAYDPGASAGGSINLQKCIVSLIWGDGTTGLGAVATGEGGKIVARVATTTAPTTACRVLVYWSESGADGTWKPGGKADATILANDESSHEFDAAYGKYWIVAFYRVAGTAVYCDCHVSESTSHTVA